MITLPKSIEIVEVGPRDGLQDEPTVLSTSSKLAYAEAVIAAGIRRIEVASFVNPSRVPQMADAEAMIAGLADHTDARLIGLVLNDRGLDRALSTAIPEINVVVITTDSFSLANQGMDSASAMRMATAVVARAHAAGLRTGVTVSAAFGCPYEGEVPPARVLDIAQAIADAGADEISLADTIGSAVPTRTEELVAAVLASTALPVRVHFHNSRNTGLANAVAAIGAGATALDASTGGIGGCPFAPKATGNIATDDLVYMLERMGHRTGIDLATLLPTAAFLGEQLGHEVPALLPRAGTFP